MKKIITMLAGLLFITGSIQAKEIPASVTKAFAQQFPGAKKVKWQEEKDKSFEANFTLNNQEVSATYDANGVLLETETEIAMADLPAPVKAAVEKKYPNTKIREAAKIERKGKPACYEAEIKLNGKKTDLIIDENGNFIQ